MQVKSWNSCVEFNSSFFVFWGIPFGGFWSKKTWTNMNKLEKACINFLRLLIKSTSQAVDIFKISRTEIKPPILDIFFFIFWIIFFIFLADKFECEPAWSIFAMRDCTDHNFGLLFRKNFITSKNCEFVAKSNF